MKSGAPSSPGGHIASAENEHCPFASVPVELKELRAWLPFKTQRRTGKDGKDKMQKVPYNVGGRKADYTNPREWMMFEAALRMIRRGEYDGLGFVIDRRSGIVGYDAD